METMKKAGIIMTIVSVMLLLLNIFYFIKSDYQYEKSIHSYWSLADKSSTIAEKSVYIDKFIKSLEHNIAQGEYNAIIFKTPDNSFDFNLQAIKTLQTRLHEIQQMDIKSFEYQTAIQQITQQEQGEAGKMLQVFQGTWYKSNYILLWDWIGCTQIILLVIILLAGLIMWLNDYL